VKIEINEKGTITGRYLGNQIATIDNTTNQDGTSSWSGKFMQMTNKGDMMVATGSGTGDPPNSKGIVKGSSIGRSVPYPLLFKTIMTGFKPNLMIVDTSMPVI
jgi:hypothetical protein